jgi:hypothetical protein
VLAPDVLVAATGTATVAPLLQATRTVPIVFATVIDPVVAGFVASLARPGGNATGFTLYEYSMSGKWLELISYRPDLIDQFRRAAGYLDRILKGEKPAELPVQAPTKFELVINLKTAKTLGLEVPPSLVVRAERWALVVFAEQYSWNIERQRLSGQASATLIDVGGLDGEHDVVAVAEHEHLGGPPDDPLQLDHGAHLQLILPKHQMLDEVPGQAPGPER